MHFVIHLFAVAICALFLNRVGKEDGRRLVGIFAVAYLVRGAFILCLHQFSHTGLFFFDDVQYHEQGQLIAFGKNIGPLSEALGTTHTGYPALIGWLYSVADRSILSAKMLNALFGALLVPVAFAICRQLWPQDKDAAFRSAWIVALFPSAVAWSGFLLKDVSLELLFAAIILLTLVAIWKRNVWAALGLLAALYLASLFRFYAVAIWAGALACAGIGYLVRRFIPKYRMGMLVAASVLSVAGLWNALIWLAPYSETVRTGAAFAYSAMSAPDVKLLDTSFTTVARGIFVYLFGPFPWVFGGFDPVNYVLFPGMYVAYAMFPIAVVGFWKQIRDLEPLKIFAFAPIILLAIIEIYFFQGAPRQRLMCEFLFCMCFAVTWPVRQEFSRITKLSYAAFGLVAFGHILANL